MKELAKEDVLKIAKLAHLEINEEEIQRYQNDLSEILKYVEKISIKEYQQVI